MVDGGQYPMRPLTAFLCGSLAVNVSLLLVLTVRPTTRPPMTQPIAAPAREASRQSAAPVAAKPANGSRLGAMTELDFRALAADLRAAGYPDDLVRIVIRDVVADHINARRRALGLDQGRDPREFWKNPVVMNSAGTPDEIAGRRALEREQRDLLRSLFGPDFDVSEETRLRRGYGLPTATAEKLNKIFADYREMEEQARDDAKNTTDIAAKLDLLAKEKRADIERLLTPEQLQEFDLRMGAGTALHNRLGQFEATEAEFRALYAAQQEFNAVNPGLRPRERNAQFEPEVRRVLGEARYGELLAANGNAARQSMEFVEMRAFVMNHNLSPAVASEVLRLQAQYGPQLKLTAQNPTLTAEQKESTRAELGATARRELLRVLGPNAYEAYDKTKSGWLPPKPNETTGARKA